MSDELIEELVPLVYNIMQIKDVIEGFKVDFLMELDCEIDSTRSWTSSKEYSSSKIFVFLQNNLKKVDKNAIVIKVDDIDKNFISQLDELETGNCSVVIESEEFVYLYNRKIFKEHLNLIKSKGVDCYIDVNS